jgi:hyaluronoglucosaminidase
MPPSVGFHSVRYQNLSIELVRAKHPVWPMEQLVAQAKVEFEAAANHWMVAVLNMLRKLRPHARFGYYGIPFNRFAYRGLGEGDCHSAPVVDVAVLRQRNDQLRPLFRAGGVLYPSIYLNGGYTAQAQRQFVSLVTAEAVRLAQGAPVLPFHWA